MKKFAISTLFAFFAICLLSFTSCNEDKDGNEVITVDGKAGVTLTMDSKGDSATVTVRGAQVWVAEASEWITIDQKKGEANKDITVKISVGANQGEERLGSVTFTLPSAEFAIATVVQAKATSN